MTIEYEATFLEIDPAALRQKIQELGGICTRPQTLQKRTVFALPHNNRNASNFVRVRDEGERITMTYKEVPDGNAAIEDPKELEIVVSDYDHAVAIITKCGAVEKAYQENTREVWSLDSVELMIDHWPLLEPFVEIEGPSEASVKDAADKLGFVWNEAIFDTVAYVYNKVYGVSYDIINNHTPRLTFDMDNPFV